MDTGRIQLRPGTLWPAMLQREQAALAAGALQPIETAGEILADAGVNFIVRKASVLARKEQARRREQRSNPFLPYEQQLFVTDVSDTHLALLNKFNVLDHHLLVITRRYRDQEALIDADDFAALAACMREFDSLGFYNAGRDAGASQPHRHMQLVPLPLARGGPAVPIEPLLDAVQGASGPCSLPAFAFRHAFSRVDPDWFDDAALASRKLHALYLALLSEAGAGVVEHAGGVRRCGPYNLVLARRWMLLVPRSREHFGPVSVNALGFAGSMFVRDEEQMHVLRQAGPMAVLAGVAPGPRQERSE
jgi:ATP adenylyltransferase